MTCESATVLDSLVYAAPSPLGMGLFAARDCEPGEILFRFSGPLISREEVIAKGIDEANPLQVGLDTYMDVGPPGVFINHSCDPNSGIDSVVDVRALRRIPSGEEILLDYSTTMSERRWTMICRCGHDDCRGIVCDFHDLPEYLRERYLALGIVQPFIVDEVIQSGIRERSATVPLWR